MTKIEELERVMETEVEMGEALLQLLTRKQQSIVGLQSDVLTLLLAQEETLLKPFRDLESERTRLTVELVESGTLPAGEEARGGVVAPGAEGLEGPFGAVAETDGPAGGELGDGG